MQGLEEKAGDADFQGKWQAMKLQAKQKAVKKIEELTGITLSPDALMDVQVKRIHEYKRQLLNLLSIVHRYHKIKQMSPEERMKVSLFLLQCVSRSDIASRLGLLLLHDSLMLSTAACEFIACLISVVAISNPVFARKYTQGFGLLPAWICQQGIRADSTDSKRYSW